MCDVHIHITTYGMTEQANQHTVSFSMNDNTIVEGTTCHAEHRKFRLPCANKECRHWMEHQSSQNCSIIAADTESPMTLHEIGLINGVTRMRICQIEKSILRKITTSSF